MRNLFKAIFPPFVGFLVYFVAVRYSSVYFALRIDQMGVGDLKSFMAFYRYLLPLLFVVAVLTQALIIVPLWNRMVGRGAGYRTAVIISLVVVCLIFAGGIGYIIWDHTTGTYKLLKMSGFMAAVQIFYWLINFLVLYLMENEEEKRKAKLEAKEEKEANGSK